MNSRLPICSAGSEPVTEVPSTWCGLRSSSMAVAALTLALALQRGAADLTDNLYYDLSTEIETPHFTWARPYARGAPRVLVIAPRWGQRETVELVQRFDLDCEVLMTIRHNLLGGRGYGPVQFMTVDRVARHFDAVLEEPFDALVIGMFDWAAMLIEHRYRILQKVHDEGAGLVYVAPSRKNEELAQLFAKQPAPAAERERLLAGIPWDALSLLRELQPEETLRAGRFGKGRWLALHYRTGSTNHCLTPATANWEPERHWEYEYYQSLLGRAVLWAADREPPATIGAVSRQRVEREQMPATVSVRIHADTGFPNAKLRLWCHALPGHKQVAGPEQAIAIGPGENTVELRLPVLPAGQWMLNATLLDARGHTVAWGSFPLEVVYGNSIAELVLEHEFRDAAEPLRGAVRLNRPLAVGESLAVRWEDKHGRLLAETIKTHGQQWQIEHPGIRPLGTNIHFLRAVLRDDRGEAASGQVEFSVRGRERPAFHLATWEEPQTDYMSDLWYRRFRELGFDAIYYTIGRQDSRVASRLIARNHLFSTPNFVAHSAKSEETELGPVHTNCLFDPEYHHAVHERNLEVAKTWGRYDVLYYTDGSDKVMSGQCFNKHTLRAFREHLRRTHANLDELNRHWGTSFESWDTVVPETLARAKKRERYTSWVEHLRFMEDAFVEHDRRMQATLRSVHADALMGHDGYGRLNSRDGADWWKLLHTNSYYNLYTYQDPPQLEITRSIARHCPNVEQRSIYYGSYNGHFGNYPFLRRLPWYALLHDYTGLFCWTANGKVTYSTMSSFMLGPDFRPTKSFVVGQEQMDAINDGVVQLIAPAKRRHNGIAIYYDHPCAVHAMTAFQHPSILVSGLSAFQHMLEDLGLQYEYLVPQQIEAGGLHDEGHRVLFLVYTLAMPKSTAAAVAKFVRSGGLVIANVLPATHDEDLNPAPDGSLLAAIFGPPGQTHPFGKGAGLLLDDPRTEYTRQRYEAEGMNMRRWLAEVLEQANLPHFAMLEAAGEDAGIPGLELIHYASDQGPGDYIGLLHSAADPVSALVSIPEPRHVYDLRGGTLLGHVRQWPVALSDGHTALFAALPYAIGELSLMGIEQAVRGERYQLDVSLRTAEDASPALPHAVRVRVSDPEDREHPLYGGIVTTGDGGRTSTSIPFALNDPPGTWTIQATERAGNASARLTVTVE